MEHDTRLTSLYRLLLSFSDRGIDDFVVSVCTGVTEIYSLRGAGIALKSNYLSDSYRIDYVSGELSGLRESEFQIAGSSPVFTGGTAPGRGLAELVRLFRCSNGEMAFLALPGTQALPSSPDVELFINHFYDIVLKKNRRPLQKDVEEQYSKYRDLFDFSPSFLFILDTLGTIVEANSSCRRRSRYTSAVPGDRNNMVGLNFTEFVAHDDVERVSHKFALLYEKVRELKKNILENGGGMETFITEAKNHSLGWEPVKIIGADGSVHHVELDACLRVDGNGNIIGAACTAFDRTEIRETRRLLKESEENYKTIFDTSPSLSVLIDMDGNIVAMNRIGTEKYGYDLNDSAINFKEFVHEQDINKAINVFRTLYKSAADIRKNWDMRRVLADAEYRALCYGELLQTGIKDEPLMVYHRDRHTVFNVEFSVNLRVDRETLDINGVLVTAVDVTKRAKLAAKLRESEEKYRELFKLSPMHSMLIDVNGRVVEFNYKAIEDYGISPEQKEITYRDFLHRDDIPKCEELFIKLYAEAARIRGLWKDKGDISREECFMLLRKLGIWGEPARLVNHDRSTSYECEFNASLWLGEEKAAIKGALLTALDVSERNRLRHEIIDSEKKYRELIEKKTRDIIFTTDRNGNFITANRNFRIKLGYSESYLSGRHLSSILYNDPMDTDGINRAAFRENIDKVLEGGENDVRFNAVCRHFFLGEPVTLHFKIDPVREAGVVAGIMGFMSDISEDPLGKYLAGESISYRIENRLTRVDDISYRLTRSLSKYFDSHKVSMIRLGLREIIVNAIEHGNLKISFQDKTEAQDKGVFFELLQRRQSDAGLSGKAVKIDYRLEADRAVYEIIDEGEGFDYKKILEEDISTLNELNLEHGRGIVLAKSIFDTLEFDGKGNRVVLTVFFPGRQENDR